MSARLLRVEGLRVSFPSRHGEVLPVRDVSFSIERGETVGLVGESGSGKTLTALSCLRLVPAPAQLSANTLTLDGTDLLRASERAMRAIRGRRIGMVAQDPLTSLHPSISIGAQINDALADHGVPRDERWRRVLEVLERVGLPDPRHLVRRYPHELSGGMRQRAMIGLALANTPSLLIADEPTTALDAMIQAQILRLLADLRAAWNMSILLISHNLGVVAGICDRLLIMYAGRIVESGPTAEVLRAPMHPYTRALLEAVPRIDRRQRLRGIPGAPPSPWDRPPGCAFHPRCAWRLDRCGATDPALTPIRPGRVVACWATLPDGSLPAAGPVSGLPAAGAADRSLTSRAGVAASPLYQLRGVTRHFPAGPAWHRAIVHALDDVSFDVHRGESLGIVGKSGSGKSTLVRLLALLDRPTRGTIVCAGQDLAHLRGSSLLAFRRRVQIVFQDPYSSLDPRYTVSDTIREALVTHRLCSPGEQSARIREALGKVGLSARFAERYPHELSGGQRQRVCIARALAVHPDVLLADEPVSALDVSIQAQMIELFEELRRQEHLTLVVVAHDLALIRQISDRVITLYLGKIVEDAPIEEYVARPLHPYSFSLACSIPRVDRVGRLPPVIVTTEAPSATDPPSGCRFHPRCFNAAPRCAREEPLLVQESHRRHVACFYPVTGEQRAGLLCSGGSPSTPAAGPPQGCAAPTSVRRRGGG
jgi:peptide/nickel transport system ATP-binding protein